MPFLPVSPSTHLPSRKPPQSPRHGGRRLSRLWFAFSLLLVVSLACSFPRLSSRPTPSPSPTHRAVAESTRLPVATPTPTPQPLPADLVESNPYQGSEVALDGSITLYFNQPMDRETVEASFAGLEGTFTWIDNSTVTFTPAVNYAPESQIDLQLDQEVKASNGLGLLQPISLVYETAGFLRLAQRLPEPDSASVNPTSAVVAAFNRPVVPLGGDPGSLLPAFTLSPQAEGRGEWLNTSTYVFYPEPALAGGVEYTVSIRPDLVGVEGSPLQERESWSFTTALPKLLTVEPADRAEGVSLDADILLTFDQPMDPQSVADNFQLQPTDGEPISGSFAWNEDQTEGIFTPDSLLKRERSYSIILDEQARSGGGTPLGSTLETTFRSVPQLAIVNTEPQEGGRLDTYAGVNVTFSAPVKSKDILQFITFEPEVSELNYYLEEDGRNLHLYGRFNPDTDYTVIFSPNLSDIWNGRLGQEYTLNFRTSPLPPQLFVTAASDIFFLTPQDSSLSVQVTNVPELSLTLGSIPLEDFQSMVAPGGYDLRQSYQPTNPYDFRLPLDTPPNVNTLVTIPLSLDGQPLTPGFYFLRIRSGALDYTATYLLVVSNVNLLYKSGATQALMWAVDLRDGSSVEEQVVIIYDENGKVLASGQTGANGLFLGDTPVQEAYYGNAYAVLGAPGEDTFSATLQNWSIGLEAGSFGLMADYRPPHLETYLYTDRPIYRPGQTVFFRAVARQAYNGRYSMPEQPTLPLTLFNEMGERITGFDLPLSVFGTAHGSFELPEDQPPGVYRITSETPQSYNEVTFQVAEYRKPEIDLSVTFATEQARVGDQLEATVSARYFFDAPAGNVPVTWALFREPAGFTLPEYQVGKLDLYWLSAYPGIRLGTFGEQVEQGEGKTNPEGELTLNLPTQPGDDRYRYTLEVTATDETGLPVSGRGSVYVNPAAYFIGVQPDRWVSPVESEIGFDVLTVDWDQQPVGERSLRAEFRKVIWEQREPDPEMPFGSPTLVPLYTAIGSTDFTTGPEGKARVAFTPPEPGTYQLDVSGMDTEGEGALTEALLWVSGPGDAVWPDLPSQRLRLTADKESYQSGDTAQVFIPNPIGQTVQALLTYERGAILSHEIVQVDAEGLNLSVPLSAEDAPNIFLSITLLKPVDGGPADFRQGYVVLPVEPVEQTLQVTLTSEPQRSEPGGQVSFDLRVLDAQGNPVQGEFSLAVVDKAVLALADPNSEEIVPAFYGPQPLGVQTSMGLAASTQRLSQLPAGMGGGGGEAAIPIAVREDFPDSAFWNAELVTDENGYAQVSLTLPDSLTTWDVDARGVTEDTRVGQAKDAVVSTKDLLIRPVAPRFLVLGDRAMLAAVVQNNTSGSLAAKVELQATGFMLDDPDLAVQQVELPAGGRARVEWWGTAQDVDSAELIFSAASGDLSDAARPTQGNLPILRFTAPQTFGTSGVLDSGGEQLELVSLPRSFDPSGGELRVNLSPNLGAAMLKGLDALEHFSCECNELIVSRFLPNLESYRVLQDLGLEDAELQSRLERTMEDSLALLTARQNEDGGWGWWRGGESDSYMTAYVLLGLVRARQAGVTVDDNTIQRATEYLMATLPSPAMLDETWEFDRLAFSLYVLAEAGEGDLGSASGLYEERARLNPWSQALLALTLDSLSPGDERVQTLFSDLEASASRSATGAHWENQDASWQNMSTTLQSTAVVLYALAQHDPASPLVADALRYLMSNRNALEAWASSYETAWSLMSLAEVMQGTGELSGNFAFAAELNNTPLASGQAAGASQLNSVEASAEIDQLYPDAPNSLTIERQGGPGRLYYTAHLLVNRPVEEVAPLNQGLNVIRAYFPGGEDCPEGECASIQSAKTGDLVTVRVTVTVPETAYYLMVEDYIPAGSEVLNTSLKTSQLGAEPTLDPARPLDEGWGWWDFRPPQVYDDHIAWAADWLPAGTYELVYQLVMLQPGDYRVLPARAWQSYFPEVQGNSAGEIFKIEE